MCQYLWLCITSYDVFGIHRTNKAQFLKVFITLEYFLLCIGKIYTHKIYGLAPSSGFNVGTSKSTEHGLVKHRLVIFPAKISILGEQIVLMNSSNYTSFLKKNYNLDYEKPLLKIFQSRTVTSNNKTK